MAKLDVNDVPQIRSTGLEVGPGSQFPVSGSTNVDAIQGGANTLAAGVGKISEHFAAERQKANTYVAASRELDFANEASALIYDAETGFLSLQGEKAMDTADVHDQIEALRQKHLGTLQTEEARRDFDLRTRVRAQAMADTVERHAAAQRHKVYGATAEAMTANTEDEVVKVYNHPEKVDLLIGLALDPKGAVMTYVREQGLKPAQVERFTKDFAARMYVKVLEAYQANKQFEAGKAYLDQVKDTLGATATPWIKSFGELSEKARVEALSTSAWQVIEANATDPVTKRFQPDLARGALVELYKPEDRALIETEVEKEIAVATAAQTERDIQAISRLDRKILTSGGFSMTDRDFVGLDDEGKAKVLRIKQAHTRSLRAERSTERVIQNSNNEIALREFRSNPDPQARADTTDEQLRAAFPDVDRLGFAKLTEARAAAQISVKNKATASSKWFGAEVNRIAVDMPATDSKLLRAKMADWYDNYLVTKQKEPTEQEALLRLAEALTQYDTIGRDKYGFELPDGHDYEVADEQKFDLAALGLAQKIEAPAPAAQGPVRKRGREIDSSLPSDMEFQWDPNTGEWVEVQ